MQRQLHTTSPKQTNSQPTCLPWKSTPCFLLTGVALYDMQYPFGQFGSAVRVTEYAVLEVCPLTTLVHPQPALCGRAE